VVAAVAGGLLVVVAGVLQERVLARRREAALQPVIAMLDGLQAPAVPAPPIARAAPPRATAQPRARLAPLLRPEIDAGLLDVDEDDASARVTLVGDRFYDPGEAAVRGDHRAVLARVARALDALPGVVVVAGHTDDRPVRSPSRLDTNEALSLERARRVAALLAATLADPSRLRIEGWADRRPRASNATEAGRARNRRVEITWQAPQPVPVPVPAGSADDAAPR
jgi:type VI secretion system protein ImpK